MARVEGHAYKAVCMYAEKIMLIFGLDVILSLGRQLGLKHGKISNIDPD